MSTTSQRSLPLKQKGNLHNTEHISLRGWVMIILLSSLGAINYSDRALLGLAAVPIIKELHLNPAQYGLVSGSFFWLFGLSSLFVTAWSDSIGTKKVLALLATAWAIVQCGTLFVFTFLALLLTRVVLGAGEGPSYGTSVSAAVRWLPASRRAFGLAIVGLGSAVGPLILAPPLTLLIVTVEWRAAFALLGGIGILWVILWLLVERERPEAGPIPADETQVGRSKVRWLQILRITCSPTILCSLLAAFGFYWAIALSLSWNPIYLATVRHLSLSDPLYIAGITLPYLVGGIGLIAFGALADLIFRRTQSHRRAYVYFIATLFVVSSFCLYLAMNISSTLGAVIFLALVPAATGAPMLVTIITAVAPAAYRGTVLGIVIAVSSLSGIIASLVTGLIIQAAGKNAVAGFHNAYLLANVLLLIIGGVFLAFAKPDGKQQEGKSSEVGVQQSPV